MDLLVLLAVRRELGVWIDVDDCEQVGENSKIKASVLTGGEFLQAASSESTADDHSVYVDEIPCLGAGEQRSHLAACDIVHVQDGSDARGDWRLAADIGGELNFP